VLWVAGVQGPAVVSDLQIADVGVLAQDELPAVLLLVFVLDRAHSY